MVEKTVQGPQDPIKFISITDNKEVTAITSDLLNQRIREEEQRQGMPIEDILVGAKRPKEEDPNKLDPAKDVRADAKETRQSNLKRLGNQAVENFKKRFEEETFSLENFFGPDKSDAEIVKSDNNETSDLMRMASIISKERQAEASNNLPKQYDLFDKNVGSESSDSIKVESESDDDMKKSLESIDKNITELVKITKSEKREDETEDEFIQREIDRLRQKEEEFAAREGKERQVVDLRDRAERLEGSDETTANKFKISNLDRLGTEFDKNFARRLNEEAPFLNLFSDKLSKANEPGSEIGGLDILGLGGLKNAKIPAAVPGIGGTKLLPRMLKGGLAGAAVGGLSYLASDYIGSQEQEVIPGVENEDLKLGVDIGSSALTGAAMGAAFGPAGALIGGAAGLGYGLYENWNKIEEEWSEGEDKISKGWNDWWGEDENEDTKMVNDKGNKNTAELKRSAEIVNDKVSKTTTELKRNTDTVSELRNVTRDSKGTTTTVTTINNSTSERARTVVLSSTAGDAKSLRLNQMGY